MSSGYSFLQVAEYPVILDRVRCFGLDQKTQTFTSRRLVRGGTDFLRALGPSAKRPGLVPHPSCGPPSSHMRRRAQVFGVPWAPLLWPVRAAEWPSRRSPCGKELTLAPPRPRDSREPVLSPFARA